MRVIFFLFCFVLFSSCNNKNEGKKIDKSVYQKYINDLTERCIKKGDSDAFGILISHYGKINTGRYEAFPLAIIMADKYNDDNARVAIYFLMIQMHNEGIFKEELFFNLKKSQQDFVVSYLIEGAKNNNPGCKAILKKTILGGYKLKNEAIQFESLANK